MRILWHGVGPWHKTGYGVQAALFIPRLRDLGHEVVIAQMGRMGIDDDPAKAHPDAQEALRTGQWQGIRVIGPGLTEFSLPLPLDIRAAFGANDPDLVIVLKDAWVLRPEPYRRYKTAVWTNIDCEPMGWPDRQFFAVSGATPIATSLWGAAQMREAGLDPVYVPHGIDLGLYQPELLKDKGAARARLGLPAGAFIAGINAANIGIPSRKAFPEQFAAFATFHATHPDSLLLCHTVPVHPEGLDLRALADALRIGEAVKFGSHMNMTGAQMLAWYQSLDVLLSATYGEGFGVPAVEAMACGVPVIGTDCSALPEKIPGHAGWLVKGQRWWNPHHRAWWVIPSSGQIAACLRKAARRRPGAASMIRDAAARYDADLVTKEHWQPALEQLMGA